MEIKELRKRLGLTQEKLAVMLGVSCYTVKRWEQGRCKPSPLARRAIDEFLKRMKEEQGP
jgi:DNA-binding transcriptional regulator YiaG